MVKLAKSVSVVSRNYDESLVKIPVVMTTDFLDKWGLLQGRWEGIGQGQFPGIHSFTYREVLTFEIDYKRHFIHYDQRTFLVEENRNSHWETGFIFPDVNKGIVKLNCVQTGGRVEMMEGNYEGSKAFFSTIQFYGDQRMVASNRVWMWDEKEINYEMFMQTSSVKGQLPHLNASLYKVNL